MTAAAVAPEAPYSQRWPHDLEQAQHMLRELEQHQAQAPGQGAAVLEPLNRLWIVIDRANNEAGLLRNVHPDPAVRAQAEAAEQAIAKLVTDIGLSRPLYAAMAAVPVAELDAPTQRWVAHTLRDFRRAGVDKSDAEQAQVRALRDELVQIGQAFDKNIREDVRRISIGKDALAGLPADYVEGHPADAHGQVQLSTDYPDYLPFMTYARDDAARKALFVAFRQRGYPANEPVLQALLAKRRKLATLLGYKSWADFITEDKMIRRADAARAFIERVDTLARPRAQRDYEELLGALRQHHPDAKAVGDWQKTFIEEQVKREHYQLDAQALRAYLPYGRVRDGILATAAQMFDVRIERIHVPTWHEDVVAYEMHDAAGRIGRFYLDMHPRADKYKHAAAFPLRSGVAGVQVPEAALVCNFPAGEDALMEHDDVETFFHEFGHLLHHLFAGKQRWVAQSGIATEWDFVEAPSQMLEEWAYDADTLKSFARNAQNETIPDALIASLRRARALGRGLWVRQQMFYAALSLTLHETPEHDPVHENTDALTQRLQARYSPFAYVPNTHFQLSFGHLEGYSAIYYTYMWSLVLAKDMFSAFAATGNLRDPGVAQHYRKSVLAPGGSRDAADLVQDFLGRPSQFEAFAGWVNEAG